jgi:hypothetical protein
MSANDPVSEYLYDKGCSPRVIAGGMEGLLEGWENLVNTVEAGYALGLDDYLNDLDVRQLIDEALSVATATQRQSVVARLQRIDEQMQALVEPIDNCLWGAEVAEEEGWTARANWWYYSRPRKGDADFLAELDEAVGAA